MVKASPLFCAFNLVLWIIAITVIFNYHYRNSVPIVKEQISPGVGQEHVLSPNAIRKPVAEPNVGFLEEPSKNLKAENEQIAQIDEKLNHITTPAKSTTAPKPVTKKEEPYGTGNSYKGGTISWKQFLQLRTPTLHKPTTDFTQMVSTLSLRTCSASMVSELRRPMLSDTDLEWCLWALKPTGGRVIVGRSYGTLRGKDRDKFEQLDCNSVSAGLSPSCDDSWGENKIKAWKNSSRDICGSKSVYTSTMNCMDSKSASRFCILEDAMFDFSKMQDIPRPGRSTGSRKWEPGFLSTHCDVGNNEREAGNYHKYYLPTVDPQQTQCHHVFEEPVLAYGHDDVKNLGHSMNDVMNVWVMLWLSGLGEYSKDITFFNIDALRQGHNYFDKLATVGDHYTKGFHQIKKAAEYSAAMKKGNGSNVCFKKLLFPPMPLMLFTWDGWWSDMKCTFKGPSSLFQRWNLQVRNNYALLDAQHMPTDTHIQVVLIVRRTKSRDVHYTSRVFQNEQLVVSQLQGLVDDLSVRASLGEGKISLVVQDLAQLSFPEQVRLMSSTSIVIGMHGAGIPNAMHMPIGTKYCCGMIEIFPNGEFSGIRGYGNMARRMGLVYNSLHLKNNDMGQGFLSQLRSKARDLIDLMRNPQTATCVLPAAIDDPYFMNG